jgi:nucleotide-binding universal stress UspA family protein
MSQEPGPARRGAAVQPAIVVGVDGSHGAACALDFAIEEARLRGAPLVIACAWSVPRVLLAERGLAVDLATLRDELRGDAQAIVGNAVSAAGGRLAGIAFEQHVEEGQPAEVLLELARGARLLVVGSRGLGGFRGLLVGSVSRSAPTTPPVLS